MEGFVITQSLQTSNYVTRNHSSFAFACVLDPQRVHLQRLMVGVY